MSRLIPIAGVRRNVVDPHYRYKMPPIVVETGRSNVTVIGNLAKVASCLHRPPEEIVKFLAFKLAVASSPAKGSLKGRHPANELQRLLAQYIDVCVLCPSCGLPETHYTIVNGRVCHDCNACGGTTEADLETDHQMTKSILNSLKTKQKQLSKKERRKARQEEKKHRDDRKQRQGQQKPKGEPAVVANPKDIAWDSDTDDASALEQTIKSFRRFIRKEWSPGQDVDVVVQELTNRQVAALLPSSDRVVILLRAVLRRKTRKGWKEDIRALIPILLRLVGEDGSLERHVLAALEVVCRDHPNFFPVLALLLYEGDVLSEDAILAWAEDVGAGIRVYPRDVVDEQRRKGLHAQAQPLIDWLMEDESSSEED